MINRMQKWIYVIILLTGYSIRSYTQETINLNIPVEQNWMFDNEHPVRFMLELTSAQSGFSDRIRMDIATDFGNAVSSTFITYSFGTDSIALIDDICHAEIKEEKIINKRFYHTIKEVKNGEGPHPIKTPQGWLHLAHGVRGCAAGLRYVLYLYMTSLEDPTQIIAEPAGYFMAPIGEERIGDVSNVLFSNGWIEDDNGKVYIYYASSDTRLHVAESTVSQLVDYCLHTPTDGFRSIESVKRIITMVNHNKQYLKQ